MSDKPELPEPTPEMVAAYLNANRAYWQRIDSEPGVIGKWRNGTPEEATAYSLRAALAAQAEKHAAEMEKLRAENFARRTAERDALVHALRLIEYATSPKPDDGGYHECAHELALAAQTAREPVQPLTDADIDAACKSEPAAIVALMHNAVSVVEFKLALRSICRAIERLITERMSAGGKT